MIAPPWISRTKSQKMAIWPKDAQATQVSARPGISNAPTVMMFFWVKNGDIWEFYGISMISMI